MLDKVLPDPDEVAVWPLWPNTGSQWPRLDNGKLSKPRPEVRRTFASPGWPEPPRWRWTCSCGADHVVRQDSLTAAYVEAFEAGRRDILLGVDL
jgi:hypothetical protein